MEELAQSVGNEKMPGEFDWDAATVVDPNTNDGGSFQHLVDSNPALGREEVLSLLSQKIAQLTPGPKKVLAMHFHEHLDCRPLERAITLRHGRCSAVNDPLSGRSRPCRRL